jgi:hypothetical protein
MSFSAEYLKWCWEHRSIWSKKETCVGDWYLTGDPLDLHLVGEGEEGSVSFSNPQFAFVPDADDLFELVDNQIKFLGVDPGTKVLSIHYDPENRWHMTIEYDDGISFAQRKESLHSMLIGIIHALAARVR